MHVRGGAERGAEGVDERVLRDGGACKAQQMERDGAMRIGAADENATADSVLQIEDGEGSGAASVRRGAARCGVRGEMENAGICAGGTRSAAGVRPDGFDDVVQPASDGRWSVVGE